MMTGHNQQLRNSRIREDGWLQPGIARQLLNNFMLKNRYCGTWEAARAVHFTFRVLFFKVSSQVAKSVSVCKVSPGTLNGDHLGG